MFDTSASLLDRLRQQPDASAWQRFVDLYRPLIIGWLRRQTVLGEDADDIAQEVLTVVIRKLPQFRRERPGSFRCWLRAITVNCLRDFWRAQRARPLATGDSNFQQMLDQLEDPQSALSRQWDDEHDRHVFRRLQEMVKPQFEAATWRAFERLALEGAPAEQVAAELGTTVNAVQISKSRVLARLRQEGAELLD